MQRYDAVVVGLGAMGSAALYHLAKRGWQVLGLEAQPEVAHNKGSSHGETRIIRLAYQEHPDYVPLLRQSYALWRQLEQESGMDILTTTGCLDCSPPSGAAGTPHGHSCFEGALASARQHGLAHEVLSAAQVNARFPGYSLPEGFQALYQPDGGYLIPEQGIRAHVAVAQQHGARVACGTRVVSWEPAPAPASAPASAAAAHSGSGGASGDAGAAAEGVAVHTEAPGGERGSVWARWVVMAPGPWLSKLVPELGGLLQVERQVVGWFGLQLPQDFPPGRFPVFLLQDDLGYFYGFPPDKHGFKIGKYHHRREVVDPDSLDREVTPEDEQVLRQCVERYFPGAAGPLERASVCMFTNTPDEHFLLDRHPRHPQVVLCSACSGHGFKFASVIGSLLADLAGGSTQREAEFLRISALRPGHSALLQRFGVGGGGSSSSVGRGPTGDSLS